MRERLRHAAVTVCLLLLPAAVLSQAEVTALSSDSEPLESTDQLRLSRFADFSEETTVAVGAELEVGDLLSSVSEAIDVELACGEETVLRFSGGFRLLIEEPAETDCAVDMLSGTVDAQTDTPVEVGAGNVTLGVEGTQFSLSLSRTDEGPDRDLSVFEGTVRVRGESIDEEVETGRSWKYAKGEQVWGQVSEVRAERTAALNARLELSKSIAAGEEVEDREKSLSDLRALHYQVLTQPADKESRVELAKAQLRFNRDDSAAYHLKRADVETEEDLERYQIDKRVMPYLSKSAVAAPTRDLGTLQTTPSVSGRITTTSADPFQLIQGGQYAEAVRLLERDESPTSRTYYGLARGHAGLGNRDKAKAYASRALQLHGTDAKLSQQEQVWCRRTGGRPRR